MMLKLFSISYGLFILFTCNSECRIVKEKYDNGQEKTVHVYTTCDDTSHYKRLLYYENGHLSSEGHVKEGKMNGHFKSWYANGQKQREAHLKMGLLNGYLIDWYATGHVACKGHYVNDKKNGLWTFYEENGGYTTRHFRMDCLTGYTHEHLVDSAGVVSIVIGQYKDCKEYGKWKWFNKDSVLVREVLYDDDGNAITKEYKDGVLQ